MDVKELRTATVQKLRHEIRLVKLRIRRAQNQIQLATTDLLEFEQLHLEVPTLEKAVGEYKAAVDDFQTLTQRLTELEA